MVQAWASLYVGAFLKAVGGQDVFLSSRQMGIQDESLPDKWGTKGHDSWVFSIALAGHPNLCLDLPSEVKGTMLQAWECNGHEGQLFFFDAGTFKIQYAGDSSMCLDAQQGDKGQQLMLWECNDLPAQKFGYDYDSSTDSGRITLGDGVSAIATLCVELAGGSTDSGAIPQVAECSSAPAFTLKAGITIRSGANYQVCIDLAGGNAVNGADVELWECNGLINQQWVFESGSYAIKWAGDTNFCIDSGALAEGNGLFLWDCNGLEQQKWGYDSQAGTIYTLDSTNLCLDIPAGDWTMGNVAELWECNGCWNQQWAVVGPRSAALSSALATVPPGDVCPGLPSPGPAPGPAPAPITVFMPDCANAAAGWPTFNSVTDLTNDAEWSTYFTLVYGGIPQTGYPICVGAFVQIVIRGKQTTKPVQQCQDSTGQDGDLVTIGKPYNCCDPPDNLVSFIYNTKNLGNAVPENNWVEIQHVSFIQDKHSAWYYLAFGSAIWWNVGKTVVYKDHPDVSLALLGTTCKDEPGHGTPPTECELDFNKWFVEARKKGLQSIQITHHYDCGCGPTGPSSWTEGKINHNRQCQLEIIDVNGHGNAHGGCASLTYKAGWMATQDCACNDGLSYTNCAGFGLR